MFEKLELYTDRGRLVNEEYDEVVACKINNWEDFALFKKFCEEIDTPITMPCSDDKEMTYCFVLSLGRNGNLRFVPLTLSSISALRFLD